MLISIIIGCSFYKFGFEKKEFNIIKKTIAYLSFSIATLFINVIFIFNSLIYLNSMNIKNAENIIIEGTIIEYKQYKFTKNIKISDKKNNIIYEFSVNKKYTVGNNYIMNLKLGKLDILYK